MYKRIKNIVKLLIPSSLMSKYEFGIRNLLSYWYKGNEVECTICERSFSEFISLEDEGKPDHVCPSCGSIERKRALWLLLKEVLGEEKPMKVLHISPSLAIKRAIKANRLVHYSSSDFSNNLEDYSFDVTSITMGSSKIDLLICLHVLEHVENDRKAMKEFYRIIKPGGSAILQVPFKEGDTLEDPLIVSPEARKDLFGQEDHLRYYGLNDFKARLELVGFTTRIIKPCADFTAEEMAKYGLKKEETFVIAKKQQL